MSVCAYIGLGSNMGDRRAFIGRAIEELERVTGCFRVRCSDLYESDPWGREDQPAYLNAVAEVWTSLSPPELLVELQRIEAEIGRRREEEPERWGPRVIDLDLLLYGTVVVHEEGLEIPHPHLHQRSFVLKPLCDLNERAMHPGINRPAAELLASAADSDHVRRWQP